MKRVLLGEQAGDDGPRGVYAGPADVALPLIFAGGLIAVEVALIDRGHALAGDVADAVLLYILLQAGPWPNQSRSALLGGYARKALLALALVPLIRVLGFGLPLRDASPAAATLLIAVLVGSTALAMAPTAGLSRRSILVARSYVQQLAGVLAGLALGFVAYLLGAPGLWATGAGADRVVVGICAAAATAIAEELVFRGTVQAGLHRAAGRLGVLVAVALFTSTYLLAGSVALVLTIALAGLVFAVVVARTGTLIGAIGGHLGLALGAGGIFPVLLGRDHPPWLSQLPAAIGLAALIVAMVALLRWSIPGRPTPGTESSGPTGEQPSSPDGVADERASTRADAVEEESSNPGPVVDIVITNHNYGEFLATAIESACGQTHGEVNVVVVDDGSSDESRDVLRRYEDAVTVVLKDNGGQASAINAGLAVCEGDVVMLLDADDVLQPYAAARVAAVLGADPGVARVQFRMDVIDARGRPTGVTKPHRHIPMPSGDLRAAELAFPFDLSWTGGASGNAYRTAALRRILPIPECDYPVRGADWYFVHLTSLLGNVVSLPDVCSSYRIHGRNGYEPQGVQLDLDHLRETIRYSRSTARALEQLADEIGLARFARILSLAELSQRLISLRLEPDKHPVADDRAWGLVADAVRACQRRFDIDWPMKAMFVMWFVAVAVCPPALTRSLAEPFLFPERRPWLNRLLGRLHRGRALRPGPVSHP